MVSVTQKRPHTNSTRKMLPRSHPDRIHVAFDGHRIIDNAGLILPATSGRKPTSLHKESWKAIQKARRKGISLRAIERELGIHRGTIRRYLDAEGPPTRQSRAAPTASSSDTIAA